MKEYPTDMIRNVALVSHAGAGKTSLGEAMFVARVGRSAHVPFRMSARTSPNPDYLATCHDQRQRTVTEGGKFNLAKISTRSRPHILKTPNRVSPTGAFSAVRRLNARTSRDFRGSIIPSSQSRAEA